MDCIAKGGVFTAGCQVIRIATPHWMLICAERWASSTCTSPASHKTHFLCCTLRCIPDLVRGEERDMFESKTPKHMKYSKQWNIHPWVHFLRSQKSFLVMLLATISLCLYHLSQPLWLPLATPVTTRIKTTAARCIAISSNKKNPPFTCKKKK